MALDENFGSNNLQPFYHATTMRASGRSLVDCEGDTNRGYYSYSVVSHSVIFFDSGTSLATMAGISYVAYRFEKASLTLDIWHKHASRRDP